MVKLTYTEKAGFFISKKLLMGTSLGKGFHDIRHGFSIYSLINFACLKYDRFMGYPGNHIPFTFGYDFRGMNFSTKNMILTFYYYEKARDKNRSFDED